MKKQFTRHFARRSALIVTAVVFAVSTPLSMAGRVAADQWDAQINALRNQANQYQSQANELKARGDTLQNKLDTINAEKLALEASIAANNQKHEKLKADIVANQKKLEQTQDALGDMLANLYIDGKISSLELLASSQNISEYVDKQEYRTTVRDALSVSIAEVKKLKTQLETDRKAIEAILAELTRQNDQLAAIQAEQQALVDQTRGEEAAYQQLVANSKTQMQSLHAQQQAYYASLGGNTGAGVVGSFKYWGLSPGNGRGGCTGGYPYCAGPLDYGVDKWNLYNRECVSYVAWALEARFGKRVGAWRGDGNAYEWPTSAARWSGAYRVASPQPGDVVVLPRSGAFAPVGHVMIVESVSGSDMFVSQYNFYGTGQYSTMWVKNSGVILLRWP